MSTSATGCLARVKYLGMILYNALQEIGYDGVWMYEISPKCPKTIIRDRDLTCADFARNAKEIFERKPLTVFSHKNMHPKSV